MEKKKTFAFGKNVYLLGKDSNGIAHWLEEASWRCEWYWGLGYVETYTNNDHPNISRDINGHQHFDSLIFDNGDANAFDKFKGYFVETPFNDKEIWKILEIMKSLYLMKKYAEMLHSGSAHISNNPCSELIKNADEYNRINKEIIPALNKELYNILYRDEVTQ